ncbi:PilW family protein [Tepidiphilus sp. HLB4]
MKIPSHASRHQLGLTLVELMVALVLGLVVIGAVVNLFLTNRQTYRTTENLARMQENLRIAYELMARDVREAGATACGATNIANVLNGTSPTWSWQGETLIASAPGATLPSFAPDNVAAGSPVLSIAKGSDPTNEIHVTDHEPASATLTLSSTTGLEKENILFVCEGPDAAIFQATNVNSSSLKVVHDSGKNADPGNCTKCLSTPVVCEGGHGAPKPKDCRNFTGGTLLKFQRILWYVGTNDRGGTSLYRKVVNNDLDKNKDKGVEMVPDIDQLTLSFLVKNDTTYRPIASVTAWQNVVAVRILVRSVSTDKIGTDGQPLRREYPFTIALRNRLN